jgi:hypothetical protein
MTTIRTLIAAALVAGSATMAFSAEGVSTYNIGNATMIEGRNSAEGRERRRHPRLHRERRPRRHRGPQQRRPPGPGLRGQRLALSIQR